MITVGIRELRQRASELIRMVREEGVSIQITHRGQAVALLIPLRHTPTQDQARAWANVDRLAAEIGARWPEGVSAAEAVAEGRR